LDFEHDELSELVIGRAYTVLNSLGPGFAEKVYENALVHELRKSGLRVEQQVPLTVRYDGFVVGEYVADIRVEGRLIIELKASKAIDDVHISQAINYLKCTGLRLCLILNFGTPRLGIKRISL